MLKAIVFDFDGVLADSLPAHLAFCERLVRKKPRGPDIPATKSLDGPSELPSVGEFKATIARREAPISPMGNFFRAVGFPESSIEEAVRLYDDGFAEVPVPLFHGAEETLRSLRRGGFRLGIVTANVRENVEAALGELLTLFDESLVLTKTDFDTETDFGEFSKVAALGMIAERLECDASELLFVGDQLSDYDDAHRAGVGFLGVTYGWAISRKDRHMALVDDVRDIPAYVRSQDRLLESLAESSPPKVFDSLAHGREMFTYYAGQRQTAFRLYLVLITLVLGGLVGLLSSEAAASRGLLWLGMPFSAIGLFVTFIFLRLDHRNQQLVESAEGLLKRLERVLHHDTGVPEYETLAKTDETAAWHSTYGGLFPAFFRVFAGVMAASFLTFMLLPAFDLPTPVAGPTDPPPAQVRDDASESATLFDNGLFMTLLLVATAALIALALLRALAQAPEDKWITGAKRATAIFGAAAALVGVIAAVIGVVGDFRGLTEQGPDLTRIYSIPGIFTPPGEPTIFVLDNDAAIIPDSTGDRLATFVIPFPEASCRQQDANGHWAGTFPSMFEAFLGNLARDLSACDAVVVVKGYASSSLVGDPGACDGARNADDANVQIANRRAENVAKVMQRAGLNASSRGWPDHDAMEKARRFNDRLVSGVYDTRRGVLNRRVEIDLMSAPPCEGKDGSVRISY